MYRVFAIGLLFVAAGPTIAAPFDAEASARRVAPFVDDQTIGVIHVDPLRIDLDATFALAGEMARMDATELKTIQLLVRQWLGTFKKAGGKEAFIVFTLADAPYFPSVLVPVDAAADAKVIVELLRQAGLEAAEQIGPMVIAGNKSAVKRFADMKPTPRPELAKAFAAAGDSAIQAAFVPTSSLRRTFEESITTLPREFGTNSVKTFTRGMMWAAAGLDTPPRAALRLTVQSEDAATAKAFALVVQNLVALGTQEAQREFPQAARLAPLFAPKVIGDQLTFVLDDKNQGIAKIVTALGPVASDRSGRSRTADNLKSIAIAMHNYYNDHNAMPVPAFLDKANKPLLSWRVHLLPYLEQDKLYREFHLDEPWDSEHNKKLIDRMPNVFRSPACKDSDKGKTSYVVPVGANTIFPGAKGVQFKEIQDGTSNTVLVIDVNDDNAVTWTKPDDLPIDPKVSPLNKLLGHHDGGFMAAMADGSVRFVSAKITDKDLQAIFTRNGGESPKIP